MVLLDGAGLHGGVDRRFVLGELLGAHLRDLLAGEGLATAVAVVLATRGA